MTRFSAVGIKFLTVIGLIILAGCCNENWRGTGDVTGTATLTGTWPGTVDRIAVRVKDHCGDEESVVGVTAESGMDTVRVRIQAGQPVVFSFEANGVIAGNCEVQFMYRLDAFNLKYTVFSTVKFKLPKNGSKFVEISGVFP